MTIITYILFYMALSGTGEVVYGTIKGFESLNACNHYRKSVPYKTYLEAVCEKAREGVK